MILKKEGGGGGVIKWIIVRSKTGRMEISARYSGVVNN
jgi:hypothetical protein